jgi:CDP-diacylglycerol--glycerol-3-phosphate 3-phosphatidyltransferase
MIKAKLGDRLDAWLQSLLPFLFRRSVNPNLLTVLGTLVSMVAAAAFALGELRWGGVLILAGGAFDLVDGVVARHHGTATTFGAFLDSTLDRLVDMALLLGIVMHYAAAGDTGHVLLAGYALVATVLVSYAKARAELFVPVFEGGLLERGERIGLLAAGAILGFLVPALWIVAVGATITVVQRFALAHRAMAQLDLEPGAGTGAAARRVAGARESS